MNSLIPTGSRSGFLLCGIRQPIGDIFVARVDATTIQQITYFDVRRTIRDERDVERYLGIQRPLNTKRVEELHKYVGFLDATFPSSIIVAVESDYGRFDEGTSEVVVSNIRLGEDKPTIAIRNVGRVIDGQHRIAGLEAFKEESDKHFDVIVAFFIGSDISDQAYVFATVNLEQTKVNKSLAYDLFELAKSRSPLKTAHNIAVALDQVASSPFYKKIKRLGVATEDRDAFETITQATFVNGLVPYISDNPKRDRDMILRGHRLVPARGPEMREAVFRNLFIQDEDRLIGKIYEEYFSAVREKWIDAWEFSGPGIMLSRTNGYRAFSSIFGRVYVALAGEIGILVARQRYRELLDLVPLEWKDFNTDKFRPGTSGEADLRRLLLSSMRLAK